MRFTLLKHRTLPRIPYNVVCHVCRSATHNTRNGFLKAAENFREEDMRADVSKYVTLVHLRPSVASWRGLPLQSIVHDNGSEQRNRQGGSTGPCKERCEQPFVFHTHHCWRVFLFSGATVHMVCRNSALGEQAKQEIISQSGNNVGLVTPPFCVYGPRGCPHVQLYCLCPRVLPTLAASGWLERPVSVRI